MDTELLVENRIADGHKLIAELVRDAFDMSVAFWARIGEEDLWFLYIGLSTADSAKIEEAYGALYACMSRIPDLGMGMSEVKLVAASDPIAAAAIAVRDRHPHGIPIRYQGKSLGGLAVGEAYIYPSIPVRRRPASAEERTLKKDVAQVDRPDDFLLTQEEKAAVGQLMSQGVNVQQAEEWVRKRREKRRPRPPIPAGTKVWTWVAAHWGDEAGDDPNPLLMVEGPQGERGLTFKEDTEPV